VTIENIDLTDLPRIVAGLVREGVTFEARPYPNGTLWFVKLLGGY